MLNKQPSLHLDNQEYPGELSHVIVKVYNQETPSSM